MAETRTKSGPLATAWSYDGYDVSTVAETMIWSVGRPEVTAWSWSGYEVTNSDRDNRKVMGSGSLEWRLVAM